MILGGMMHHFDLIKLWRGKMLVKDWAAKWFGLFKKLNEREKVEGFYTRSKLQTVREWLWEGSALSWVWIWGAGVYRVGREKGVGGLVRESKVLLGFKR